MKTHFLAVAAFCLAAVGLAYEPPAHTNSFTRAGVTYAQRGGLGNASYVVTNVTQTSAPQILPRYLHFIQLDSTYPDDAQWYYDQMGGGTAFGCSAVRRGSTVYRNYDWTFDVSPEWVVAVNAGEGRFASIGVASVGDKLTEDMVESGARSRYFKCLAGATLDGINENGVMAEINVNDGPIEGWNVDGDINVLGAVRWALDNGTNAAQAAAHLAAHVRRPSGINFHYLVADQAQTFIVENGAAHEVTNGVPVLTNFQLYPKLRGGGWERYQLLTDGNSITNCWFTRAYSPTTNPAWMSDFVDSDAKYQAALAAWNDGRGKEAHRGETVNGESWWQTVHCSVYDLQKLTLRIAVQEVDDWYVFSVPNAGGVKPEAVEEIVEPMIVAATNELAETRLPSWMTAESDEPRGKIDLDVYEEMFGDWSIMTSPSGYQSDIFISYDEDGYVTGDKGWVAGAGYNDVSCHNDDKDATSLSADGIEVETESGERISVSMTAIRQSEKEQVGKLAHMKKDAGGALPYGLAKMGAGGELTAAIEGVDYTTPANVENQIAAGISGKQDKITGFGVLKGNGQGIVSAASPSSTGGANADYRDPKDAKCYEDVFGAWSAENVPQYLELHGVPYTSAISSQWLWDAERSDQGEFEPITIESVEPKTQTFGVFRFEYGPFSFTATRSIVAAYNDTFVTWKPMTNAIARLAPIDAANPTFSNEVAKVSRTEIPALVDDAIDERVEPRLTSIETALTSVSSSKRDLVDNISASSTLGDWNFSGNLPSGTLSMVMYIDANVDAWYLNLNGSTFDRAFFPKGTGKDVREIKPYEWNVGPAQQANITASRGVVALAGESFVTPSGVRDITNADAPHVEAINPVAEFYDATRQMTWRLDAVDFELKLFAATNVDSTAFCQVNNVLTDTVTTNKTRLVVSDGEIKFFHQ